MKQIKATIHSGKMLPKGVWFCQMIISRGTMPDEEKMTIEELCKYLRKMRRRHQGASKKERGRLLDEMEAVTGMHRKSLARLMKIEPRRRERQEQRRPSYGQGVRRAVLLAADSSLRYMLSGEHVSQAWANRVVAAKVGPTPA